MIINIKNFNLEQIADSGQCFRWRKLDEGKYLIPAYDHQVTVAQSGEKFEFSCTGEEYKKIWEHYFDMKIDYGRIDRKSTRLNSSHRSQSRMPSSA